MANLPVKTISIMVLLFFVGALAYWRFATPIGNSIFLSTNFTVKNCVNETGKSGGNPNLSVIVESRDTKSENMTTTTTTTDKPRQPTINANEIIDSLNQSISSYDFSNFDSEIREKLMQKIHRFRYIVDNRGYDENGYDFDQNMIERMKKRFEKTAPLPKPEVVVTVTPTVTLEPLIITRTVRGEPVGYAETITADPVRFTPIIRYETKYMTPTTTSRVTFTPQYDVKPIDATVTFTNSPVIKSVTVTEKMVTITPTVIAPELAVHVYTHTAKPVMYQPTITAEPVYVRPTEYATTITATPTFTHKPVYVVETSTSSSSYCDYIQLQRRKKRNQPEV